MVIVRTMGGLGNQLQQYALYRKLEHMGKDVRMDISWFRNASFHAGVAAERDLELDYLSLHPYKAASEAEIRSVLGRLWEEKEHIGDKIRRKIHPQAAPAFEESDMYHEQIFAVENKYLVGYWACEKYYADIMDILREDITFLPSDDVGVQSRNDEIVCQMEETQSVSVHIRRGDYLDDANRLLFGGICTDAYYQKAIVYLQEKLSDVRFFFFSDDIPYVRERYQGEGYQFIDWNQGRNSYYDMMLMSHCKHNICANSTFSFWGARLNPYRDKVMIRPSIHKNTQICVPEQMKELWQDWVLVTPQGEVI